MSAADDLPECPLCMEVFELDDMNFFPCTCGYQICRFCWHRIRTDENGLCPACRKSYPEDPAQFKPLTDEEVHKIKKERRQKEVQRKQKSAENRKHLANFRVVQKNLVFVVGLAPRLTDPEVLKRHEYFGRFGKIHKVVINQSTSYVGSQGPSASAYVTYIRPEDALNAIKFVNNAQVDGRTIKASLGTTKYCSHFLKGTQCMKTDCMYLHDLGDEAASFTKEDIQQGKHVQYEQKLSEQYLSTVHSSNNVSETGVKMHTKPKEMSPTDSGQLSPTIPSSLESNSPCCTEPVTQATQQSTQVTPPLQNGINVVVTSSSTLATSSNSPAPPPFLVPSLTLNSGQSPGQSPRLRPLPFAISNSDHLSLFSDTFSNRVFKPVESLSSVAQDEQLPSPTVATDVREMMTTRSLSDAREVSCGSIMSSYTDAQDDDLGFDPYVVSAKGLADMIETEKANHSIPSSQVMPPPPPHLSNAALSRLASNQHMLIHALRSKLLPPGFVPPPPPHAPHHHHHPNGFIHHPTSNSHVVLSPQSSKMLNLMHLSTGVAAAPSPSAPLPPPSHISHHPMYGSDQLVFEPAARKHDAVAFYHHLQSSLASHQPPSAMFNLHEWQEGLKALLPDINISFGTQSLSSHREFGSSDIPAGPNPLNPRPILPMHSVSNYSNMPGKVWCSSSSVASHSLPDLSWDPAIINTGAIADSGLAEDPPHWMASLHHLTDDHSSGQMMHPSHSMSWLQQPPVARFPPPGFANSSVSRQLSEKQKLSEHRLPAS